MESIIKLEYSKKIVNRSKLARLIINSQLDAEGCLELAALLTDCAHKLLKEEREENDKS